MDDRHPAPEHGLPDGTAPLTDDALHGVAGGYRVQNQDRWPWSFPPEGPVSNPTRITLAG
ncbi:hypothetical protein GIS00_23205 [Nakamurella sp. YIM 132087]|uniref:Uncharacterized protein n=1 Tax=Nakamurella alba TaxID=2665158 RepID=A0A7K1FRS8_9ACTN|nr:hypothetical protein [Nakamurella alba]MTD16846.1 hypothetical protein [Nakamurella alba]